MEKDLQKHFDSLDDAQEALRTTREEWISTFKTSELKKLIKSIPGAGENGAFIEKSDLERAVLQHFVSAEEAQQELSRIDKTGATMNRLKVILSQDRHVVDFRSYQPSKEHLQRMAVLARGAPEIFNNPSITPRSMWFSHPNWGRSSQMPLYHVHFREEVQDVVRHLYDAFNTAANNRKLAVRKAFTHFNFAMTGLDGHVSIEESNVFPRIQKSFPAVNIDFLYEDHTELRKSEEGVVAAFNFVLFSDTAMEKDDIVRLLETVLDFDDHLLAHLGEEEEIVVPLTLAGSRW